MEYFKNKKTGKLERKVRDEQNAATYQDLNKIVDEVNSVESRVSTLENNNSGALAYDVISMVVSQSSTNAPTFQILENTTAATLTTGYTSTGQYTIVSDIDIFFGGKSFMMTSYPGFVEFDGYVGGYRFNNKTFVLRSGTYSGGNSNDIIDNVLVEIRIYP